MKCTFIVLLFLFCLNSNSFAQTWDKLATEYDKLFLAKNYSDAEKVGNKMLLVAKKEYGDTSLYYLSSLYSLAMIDIQQNEIRESIQKLQLAEVLSSSTAYIKGLLYQRILFELGTNYYFNKNYSESVFIFDKLFEITSTNKLIEDTKGIEAYLYRSEALIKIPEREIEGIKDLTFCVEEFINILNNNKEYTGKEKDRFFSHLASSIDAIHNYYISKGEKKAALQTSLLYNKIINYNIPLKFKLANLSNRYTDYDMLGQLNDARGVALEIIDLYESGLVFPINSCDYYYNYAVQLSHLKEFKKSNKYLFSSIEKIDDGKSFKYSRAYYLLALNYRMLGETNQATVYEGKLKKIDGSNVYNDKLSIVNSYIDLKKYDEALVLLDEVLQLTPKNSLSYLGALITKSEILSVQNQVNELINVDNELLDYYRQEILQLFPILSNSERESLVNSRKESFELILMESIYFDKKNANDLAYNTALFLKNLLLESSVYTKTIINSDSLLKHNFIELNHLKNDLANQKDQNHYSLKTRIDSLESILMRSFPKEKLETSNSKIKFNDIKRALKTNEASIEYISFFVGGIKYYRALISLSTNEFPISIHLTNRNILDSIINLIEENYSSDNLSGRTYELNKHLYHMFWEPLEPYFKEVKTIYYSPIDELNNMSFSSFVTNSVDTTYLMDKYNLQSVMSTAAIITNKTPNINNEPQSIALFGGVQYNLKTQNIKNSDLIASRSIRGVNQKNKRRDEVSELPFTQNEIDNVSSILQKAKWTILKESNIKATENKIKELESGKNPTILHFATHGFAFPDFVSNSTSTNIFENSENPMQRSGLLFYGAGDTWQGKRDTVIKYTGEDGVLTAEEVSNLDLTNTKLVVMSACQSGLGAIKGTEGVYGLKRAFKLAGVENMIVSLWPVPDKETMELMNLFYEELVKTKDINGSFQSAQKTMRYKYPSNPWAWGGFVLVR